MSFLWTILLVLPLSRAQFATVQRDTEYGPVLGEIIPEVNNGDFQTTIYSFTGVPFGASTGGNMRFRRSVKPTSWGPGVFDATQLREMCPQSSGTQNHPGWDLIGEDCLHSNIYVPSSGAGPFPVMVWFYGGAFTGGQNIMYPGHFLASRDVVVVVPNYRVNVFGFAFTDSEACRGNMGLWDQKLALEFVRDNIANFNGDPTRVTIFGQSAGGASSGLHLVSPQSQGLFHQAMMISGTETSFWALNYPESDPETYLWEVARRLNCSEGLVDEEMLDCLRMVDMQTLRKTSFPCTPGHFCQGMAPVVDGPGGFLPQKPKELRAAGSIANVPIITGCTGSDGSHYTVGMIPEALLGGFNRTMFHKYLKTRLVRIWAQAFDNVTAEDVFRAFDYNYAPWPHVEDEYENREAFNEMITDGAFWFPMDRQAKQQSEENPNVYSYVFNYRGRNSTSYAPEWMGVPHAGDLPYVWGWTLLPNNPNVRNDSEIWGNIVEWTEEDIDQTMHWEALITNFAKYGNPTPTPVMNPLGELTSWPPYSFDAMQFIYVTNTTIEIKENSRQKDYAFWTEYLSWMVEEYDMPLKHVSGGTAMPLEDDDVIPLQSSWFDEYTDDLNQRIWDSMKDEYGYEFY